MYTKIPTRTGTVLILNKLIAQVMPLITLVAPDLNKQPDAQNLMAWLVDVFGDDFEDRYGEYSNDERSVLALCVVNAKHYLIDDKAAFCAEFNAENLPVKLGFNKTFYPLEQGHFVDPMEFVLSN